MAKFSFFERSNSHLLVHSSSDGAGTEAGLTARVSQEVNPDLLHGWHNPSIVHRGLLLPRVHVGRKLEPRYSKVTTMPYG